MKTKKYSHERNVSWTLEWMLQHDYENEFNKSEEQLKELAETFCKWEENNMPKDIEGNPDWAMVVERVQEDATYVVVSDTRFGTRIACDWAECLEVFVEFGNLPKVVNEFVKRTT